MLILSSWLRLGSTEWRSQAGKITRRPGFTSTMTVLACYVEVAVTCGAMTCAWARGS